jgi:hypothetical protein
LAPGFAAEAIPPPVACRCAITHSAALRLRREEPPAAPPRSPAATAFAAAAPSNAPRLETAAPPGAALPEAAAPPGAALRVRDPVPGSGAAARGGVPERFVAFVGLTGAFLAAAIRVFLLANDCGHVSARRLRDPAWTLEAGEPF